MKIYYKKDGNYIGNNCPHGMKVGDVDVSSKTWYSADLEVGCLYCLEYCKHIVKGGNENGDLYVECRYQETLPAELFKI